MFVADTFLSSLDRLSSGSILTCKTGSLFGFLGVIIFISIIMLIKPTVQYFKEDLFKVLSSV